MATASSTRKLRQSGALLRLMLLLLILVLVNIVAARYHAGLDLTHERRFTLSPSTKKMLREMDDQAVVDVYLKGEFPAGFQRLAEAARERLEAFKNVAGSKLVFRFSDPFAGKTDQEQGAVFSAMEEKGISGVIINLGSANAQTQKIIFPYALVRYKGREMPVRLIEDHMGMTPLEKLNYSETLLEYKLANAIHLLARPTRPQIAWLVGHDESLGPQTFDFISSLNQYYQVDTINLDSSYYIPKAYAATIICKPTRPFDEKAKFKIDQYVMRGGNVLWMLDAVNASMDSLGNASQSFLAMPLELNLEDLLFRYGARINADLIEDLHCNVIPITMGGSISGRDNVELKPWQYFPLLQATQQHPIVNNLDEVNAMFASSIDTSANDGIRKTVLLQSSKYSRAAPAPVRVALSIMNARARAENYSNPYRPVAVLLEGSFKSIFKNRMAPGFLQILADSLKLPFQEVGPDNGRMIVIADGDLAENDFTRDGPMEMGYWRFTGERFANKPFLLNCVEYLADSVTLLEARNKEQRLRLLDTNRVAAQQTNWQILNIGAPILLVLLGGSAYFFFRRRRYAQRAA